MNSLCFVPKLIAPAGSLERLKIALRYGADAVYLAGPNFGLRAAADNLSLAQIATGVRYAEALGKEVYVVINAYLRDTDLEALSDYVMSLAENNVTAIVASDLGVIKTVLKSCALPIFLSTQASCLNSQTAMLWKSLGVSRIILGREVSIKEAEKIKSSANIAVEMFVHGAMCMAYSGHCTLSNFMAGRDANRGGCMHLCRHSFQFIDRDLKNKAPLPLLSSRDLCGVALIEDFCKAGIDALKIEGRMRSPLYVATVCRTYRQALDAAKLGKLDDDLLNQLKDELFHSFPNRSYCDGALVQPASRTSLFWNESTTNTFARFIGLVIDKTGERLALRLYAPLNRGDQVSFLPFSGPVKTTHIEEIYSPKGDLLQTSRQEQVVFVPVKEELIGIEPLNLIRGSMP